MMQITLNEAGKKYGKEWIFRNLSFVIESGDKVVITGSNGSGKSTLLQAIAGFQSLNKGEINYLKNDLQIGIDDIFKSLTLASPYQELIEEFSFKELISFQRTFKPFINNMSTAEIIDYAYLSNAADKPIKNYSSGMKQRVKLSLAILADCPILLLDEPSSNLDRQAIDWYKQTILKFASHKTVIVCSNKIEDEYFFCTKEIKIDDFKAK